MAKESWEDLPDVPAAGGHSEVEPLTAPPRKEAWEDLPDAQPEPQRTEEPGFFSSMAHKAVNGFLKGGSEEAQGLVAAATNADPANSRFRQPDGTMRAAGTREGVYREGRDLERRDLHAAEENYPVSGFLAELGGDVGSDAALQALGVPVLSSGYQALTGGLTGLLSSKAELTPEKTSPGDMASALASTGIGAAAGYALPKIGGRIASRYKGSGLQKMIEEASGAPGRFLKSVAESRAVKAAEPMLADYRGLARKDKLQEVGRDLLDQGVVRPLSGVKGIAKRSEKVASEQGELIRKYLGQFDDAAEGAASTDMPRVNTGALADRLERELIGPMRGSPAFDGLVPDLAKRSDLIQKAGDELSFAEANKMKGALDQFVNHSAEQTPAKEALKRFRGVLNSELEDRAQSVAPDVFPKWKEAKRLYGNMADVADMSGDKVSRDAANRFLSPSDHAVAATGILKSGPIGAALGLANNVARHHGNSTLAVGADKLAKAWETKLPTLIQNGSKALGKYSAPLARAFEAHGLDGALAMDLALEKEDPEYASRKSALLQNPP